jgi:fatty acid desaturase
VATPRPIQAEAARPDLPRGASALTATVLALSGALVFAAGATLALWPVWVLGLALFAGGLLVYVPRP